MKAASAQRGQGAAEFIVVFLSFAALMLGLFEMTRLYRAKHLLNTATFAAARAGALHHARIDPMDAELANGMAALYVAGNSSVAGLGSGVAQARLFANIPGIGVDIVSPTREAFDGLAQRQWIRLDEGTEYGWRNVIPNDNLRWRPRNMASISVGGNTQPINLQDANLLRIRSLWCHRLIVPALDRAIWAAVNILSPSNRQNVCNAISNTATNGIPSGFYLAIASDAILRMQSPVIRNDLPGS